MISNRLRSPLTWLVIAYLVLASAYSVVTPIFEASDELWHYPAVKYLADHGLALPVQDPNTQTAWRQEGSQPPLYYMLGALLTSWIDTSDLDQVRKSNPHADIGILVPDGNLNMMIHDPAVEAFPWHGTVLAVHLCRLLSVALGAITVLMTYRLAAELFPERRWLAMTAAAFTAFNPMFLFISGSVNNDNLSNALASVLLLLIVRLLKRTTAPSLRTLALIGVVTGAGMLAKFNIGFMIPLIAIALAVIAFRLRDWRPFVMGGIVTGLLTIVIAGWWYVRNLQLYGDPTGLAMFVRIVGPRNVTPNLAQLWSERHTFLMSYWGFFGGLNLALPDIVYTIFNILAALAAIGLVIGLIQWITRVRRGAQPVNWPILIGAVFTAVWISVLFVSLLRWTSMTWASQGRLMFSAIAPISLWLAVGLWKIGQPVPLLRWRLAMYAVGWSSVIAVFSLLVINRAYDNPDRNFLTFGQPKHSWNEPPSVSETDTFREPGDPHSAAYLQMQVQGLPPDLPVHVGDYLTLGEQFRFWGTPRFTRDWSVVVHLENDDGLIVAQRDMYPRQGQLATSLLDSDTSWFNQFAIRIPDFAYAPQRLKVYLAFYDAQSGERMIASGDSDVTADNRVLVGTVQLLPREAPPGLAAVPNPMRVNFGDEAELIGYDVSSLVMFPNKKVTVTFYWRALRPITKDYRVFTTVLQPNSSNTFGGDDSMPVLWTRPTHTWKPGELIKDEHTFRISPDAPPGMWQIQVGMYELTKDHQYQYLRIIQPDGSQPDTVALLTRIRMVPPPPDF